MVCLNPFKEGEKFHVKFYCEDVWGFQMREVFFYLFRFLPIFRSKLQNVK
jgi:hypothetical protein